MNLGIIYTKINVKEDKYKYYHGSFPIDTDLIPSGDKERNRFLLEESVKYFREVKKELPSRAVSQDYELDTWSWYPISRAKTEFESLGGNKEEEEYEIKVFDNAFDKIVLPTGFKEQIIEVVTQLKESEKIFTEWGLDEKFKNRGTGINILLSGESGTGKTYCGEIIAEYLGVKANLVSVATLESKWVSESERNISAVFTGLKRGGDVLILDEVDAFLTSRASLDQHHESKLVNQFLIELERHMGVCVMTTNRPVVLDKALARRVDLSLNFPFPNKEARKAIWKYIIPDKLPQEDLDFDSLAEMEMNGGIIKNSLLSAVRHMAVSGKKKMTTELLLEKGVRELAEVVALHNGKDFS